MSGSSVAVLLVTHDGAHWLPGVLDGMAEQAPLIDRVIAVDTGSRDASRDLVAEYGRRHGVPVEIVELSSTASYPEAVAAGMTRIEEEWIWLLHDDSRPAPGALAALLDAAERRDDVDLLGPKLREWPSLRRLLEVGVTISGTGRRETGLERGEYDQGQHDEELEVLAVNTAGLLVRRSVLEELGGLDPHLPMFGNDIDLGWRAVVAGHTVLAVPSAIVFHAEAAHRGVRRTALTGRHTHYQERRAALFVLLVNATALSLPFRMVRLALGTLLRMIGFLLVRSPGEALDDLAALVAVVFRPGALLAGRRARRERGGDPARVTPLLPPAWTPYRHGLDFVGDVVSALGNQAADVAERRRIAAAELDPSSLAAQRRRAEEEDELADTGAIAAFFTNPVALTMMAVVAVLFVGAGTAFGSVSGGALSPVPAEATSWWSLYLERHHQLGFGTDVPAPPYVPFLALPATVLGTELTMSIVMVLSAPLALWGAWRFLRLICRLVSLQGAPRWILVAGSTTYAVMVATSGAWGSGRFGLVAALALLPWLAHAALGFADPDGERRWRAGWRVGLLGTVVTAFAPLAWFVLAALALIVVAGGLRIAPAVIARRDVLGPLAAAVVGPVVVLAPWWLPALASGHAEMLLLEAGRQPASELGPWQALSGQVVSGQGGTWIGLVIVVAALVALIPRPTRVPVALCWLVAALVTAMAALFGVGSVELQAVATPAGLGILILIAHAALVTAAVLGAVGLARTQMATRQRVLAWTAAALVAVVPIAGLAGFVLGDHDVESSADPVVPAYMLQSGAEGNEYGVLVVRGSMEDGLRYSVRRGEGITVGQDEILAVDGTHDAADRAMSELLSRPTADAVERAAGLGLAFILLAEPADSRVAATLDAASGLAQASSGPGSRAWSFRDAPSLPEAETSGIASVRPALLIVAGLALLVLLIQCAPSLRGRRTPIESQEVES